MGCNDIVQVMGEEGVMQESTRYSGRFVGNSPELNPLDNSTFRDLRTTLNLNVAATWHLEKTDNLKFSLATPKEVTRAFLRIWDPANGVAPSSRRILEDVKKVLTSVSSIVEAKGKIVPGLVNCNGHRTPRKSTNLKPGKKTNLKDMGIHDSIRDVVLQQHQVEKKKYLGDNESSQGEETGNESHNEDVRAID